MDTCTYHWLCVPVFILGGIFTLHLGLDSKTFLRNCSKEATCPRRVDYLQNLCCDIYFTQSFNWHGFSNLIPRNLFIHIERYCAVLYEIGRALTMYTIWVSTLGIP